MAFSWASRKVRFRPQKIFFFADVQVLLSQRNVQIPLLERSGAIVSHWGVFLMKTLQDILWFLRYWFRSELPCDNFVMLCQVTVFVWVRVHWSLKAQTVPLPAPLFFSLCQVCQRASNDCVFERLCKNGPRDASWMGEENQRIWRCTSLSTISEITCICHSWLL